jgi:hypothetical protein
MNQGPRGAKSPIVVHVRPAPRASAEGPVSGGSTGPASEDLSARSLPLDALKRELQSGALPRDTEVLYPGLGDWTSAAELPELWTPIGEEPAATAAFHEPTRPSIPVASASQLPRRRSLGAMAVVGAIAAAIALLGGGALAIYFAYLHYTPVAIQHLPRRCVAAARVDLVGDLREVGLARFDPLAKVLIPAIEEATRAPAPVPPPTVPAPPDLKERLKGQAGIDLDRGAVRELAICVFQDASLPAGVKDPLAGYRAVVAVGGRVKQGAIPGLFEALAPELSPLGARLDGTGEAAVIRIPPTAATFGVAAVVGQAEDGTILLAPSDGILATAREQRPEEEARATSGLKQEGALEIAADHFVFGAIFRYEALGTPPAALESIFKPLGDVQTGRLGIRVGGAPRVELDLDQKTEAQGRETETALRQLIELADKELSAVPKDWAGEHAAVAGARIARDGTRVDLRLDFREADVARGAEAFAAEIKDPASPFRTKTWPTLAWALGLGPKPSGAKGPAPSFNEGGTGEDDDE